ncbi:MAG: hypothetical protein BMS9Abin36_0256 [Gammaproteobacteria bacterium]|nr:MAG: hypothetical protein BMS9Abin36_0256 [Gammaproteobacteria bacterium]
MKRRTVMLTIAAAAAGVTTAQFWPREGMRNPCLEGPLPKELAQHDVVQQAWQGVDAAKVWDGHVHLLGAGHGNTGTWINPQMQSLQHPIQSVQRLFYLNAACIDDEQNLDASYLRQLNQRLADFPKAARFVLLAFDYFYNDKGQAEPEHSAFYVPNDYAARVAQAHPRLEWMASIHPYRHDAVDELHNVVRRGARGIKWVPAAMGMDPASPLCDPFYEALAQHDLPLLVHVGTERAVTGSDQQDLGNPLRLRRALDHGVRVAAAHSASLGSSVDMDVGANGPERSSFELFVRLMEEARYEGQLFGEISTLTQVDRVEPALKVLLSRPQWHARLVNGSDYPLPGVMPLFSPRRLVAAGYLDAAVAPVLSRIRRYNVLLFDFVLKRHVRWRGRGFSAAVFESRRFYGPRKAI